MADTPRIATVTLNPAIDQTAYASNFHDGEVNRVTSEQSDAGGKGVNVASFLAQYGHEVAATGLLGRGNLEPFETLFAEQAIVDRFIKLPGVTRVNVKIVDKIREMVTDINFPGMPTNEESFEAVADTVDTLIAEGVEWFVLSGSLPRGIPTDSYRLLIERIQAKGRKVILDTSGVPFDRALAAGPNVIKPNIDELHEVTGSALDSNTAIISAVRSLADGAVGLAVVSMRDRGALFVTAEEAVLAVPPKARVRSTVGAGDAMVAGIAHGLMTGLPLAETARLATGFALGALGQVGPYLPSKADIAEFADLVSVTDVPSS